MGRRRIGPIWPARNFRSALNRPGFVLLNAVPGVGDEQAACHLGDGPRTVVSTVSGEAVVATGGEAVR